METIKIAKCRDCPILGRTEFAEMGVNYGCLPAPYDAIKWFRETGRVWACHSQQHKACGGVLEILMQAGLTVDFSQPLLTMTTTEEEIKQERLIKITAEERSRAMEQDPWGEYY